MRAFLALVRATHPLPAAAVTALVSVAAAAQGTGSRTLGFVIASTAAGQASVGWSNDFLDRERDAAAGRQDKPLVAGEASSALVLVLALAAYPVSVGLSLSVGEAEAVVMLVAVASAWGYNLGLKATPLSWAPYAVSFGLAPVYVSLAASDAAPPAWIVVGTALLGVAGHLMNVIPDLEADRAATVRGLPHRLGLRSSLLLACSLLGGVLVVILAATDGGASRWVAASVAAALIGGVAWAGLGGRGRLGFRVTIAAAGAIVTTFLLSGR